MDNEILIEVRKFPVLFDQSDGKYINVEHKEGIWKIILTNLQAQVKSQVPIHYFESFLALFNKSRPKHG